MMQEVEGEEKGVRGEKMAEEEGKRYIFQPQVSGCL